MSQKWVNPKNENSKIDLNPTAKHGKTLFLYACDNGHLEIVTKLMRF